MGTGITRSVPAFPDLFEVAPARPDSAANVFRKRKPTSVPRFCVASSQTSPPRPPSPPAGPPLGTYFSRRHATIPSPPLPASAAIVASSMNCIRKNQKREPRGSLSGRESAEARLDGDDVDVFAIACRREGDLTGDDREDRVILAHH